MYCARRIRNSKTAIWESGGKLQRVWNGAINFKLLLSSAKGVNAYLPSKPKGNLQEALFNS